MSDVAIYLCDIDPLGFAATGFQIPKGKVQTFDYEINDNGNISAIAPTIYNRIAPIQPKCLG